MEPYIQISKINDFLYCPMSLYLHSIYESFSEKTYHQTPQVVGKINHEAIDKAKYSSARRYVVGMEVFSRTYNIMGKIDVYDRKEKALIERKTRVKKIYLGHKYQLFAQYFALKEMGHEVEKLFMHSLEDNKRYKISLPTSKEKKEFGRLIAKINSFSMQEIRNHSCPKCAGSIYGTMGW